MSSPKSAGRTVGLLLFVHLAAGLTTPYILLQPLSTSPNFVAVAAGMSFKIRLAVLMLFVGGAVTIAVAALPFFRRHGRATALWLLALAAANFSLQCVENAGWMSMLSLSQEYARAGAGEAALFQGLGAVVRAAWKWTHYAHLLVAVAWMFLLCGVLYRSALVPRALAAFGMATALLQIAGITLPQFLGYGSVTPAGMPLGVSYLALILWLAFKGFDESRRTLHAGARAVEPAAA
ncbi:MAG TPA: DUF4386 domain-containing protein [Pyrinomonadaceae bacterium]|jgi:hypothetical protein|nr:DUF4386 domain-containing protein [Pyrinomonadaceae bacterium]